MAFFQSFALPLVAREMRVLARGRALFVMRSVVAGVMLVATLLWSGVTIGAGGTWFGVLSLMMFYGLMLTAPAVASGCVSREREQGTLGLLFLSPMRPFDIIAGKFASEFLHLLVAALAGAPVLAATLLMGGVTTGQVTGMVLSLLSLLLSTVSVAVLVSSLCERTRTAGPISFLVTLFLNFGIPMLNGWSSRAWHAPLPEPVLWLSVVRTMHAQLSWTSVQPFDAALGSFTLACLQAVGALGFASWWVPRTLAPAASEARGRGWWVRRVWRRVERLRRVDAWLRGRVPLVWLESRKVGGLMMVLPVLAVAGGAVFFCELMKGGLDTDTPMQVMWFCALPHVAIALLAIGSICVSVIRERKERGSELLRTTPQRDEAFLWANFSGVWLRFGLLYVAVGLPSLAAAIAVWGTVDSCEPRQCVFVVAEFVEDFSFVAMLFAVASYSAMQHNRVVRAMAAAVGTLVGLWVVLGIVEAGVGSLVGIAGSAWASMFGLPEQAGFCGFVALGVALKITVEIWIFVTSMEVLGHPMAEWIMEKMGPV